MRVLLINVVCGIRSTGRICTDLAIALEAQGHEVRIAYGRETVPVQFQKYSVRIGSERDVTLHGIKSRIFDASGFGSKAATNSFIEWVKRYDPDVIHIHNIHGYYINIKILFEYLKNSGKKIIWTLHDCWAFTGHASYCDAVNCTKWMDGCFHCPNIHEYPSSFIDRSYSNWCNKKKVFQGVPNLTIVTPSQWLAQLVEKSFLNEYPIRIINNGINTEVFQRRQNAIKEEYNLSEKIVILGVAAIWNKRKGFDDFLKLKSTLDSEKYGFILIGLNQEQLAKLPNGMIGFKRTDSTERLAQFYSAADVFFNPTYEDNYPTTNLEAIACGTPVITYKTGGSPESAELYGVAVEKGDLESVGRIIDNLGSLHKQEADLSTTVTVDKYLDLYNN